MQRNPKVATKSESLGSESSLPIFSDGFLICPELGGVSKTPPI